MPLAVAQERRNPQVSDFPLPVELDGTLRLSPSRPQFFPLGARVWAETWEVCETTKGEGEGLLYRLGYI